MQLRLAWVLFVLGVVAAGCGGGGGSRIVPVDRRRFRSEPTRHRENNPREHFALRAAGK